MRFMKGFLGDRDMLLPDLAFSGILGGLSEISAFVGPLARKKTQKLST